MRSQRSHALLRAVAAVVTVGLAPIDATNGQAPYSGAPFLMDTDLGAMPSRPEDGGNTEMLVSRLMKASADNTAYVSPHECDMGDEADMNKCLDKGTLGRGCMWTRLETRDPLKHVQAAKQYCLPCRMDEEVIPCWNPGAWVNGMQVTNCKMSCMHQTRIFQPEYACTDETGFISQAQCFDRGVQSQSKCMYTSFKDKKGELKGSCGPCQVAGSGGWGCPATDAPGPEEGSKVIGCLSQCDVLCSGPPACPPTVAPPPPPPPPSPGIVKVAADANEMLSAPAPFLMPTPNPYAIAQAVQDAAEAAGWKVGTTPPPKVYWPVVYYRQPMDYLFTTGPPPNLGPEPPSGLMGGAALLQSSPATSMTTLDEQLALQRKPLLRSLRRRSWGQ